LGPVISRRRALAASAAFITGLALDPTGLPAPEKARATGVVCADQKFKDCDLWALESMDQDLKPRVKGSSLDATLAIATAEINWQVRRNYCAHQAAMRHCQPCETCDAESGNCKSTCEPNETCQNGECLCGPCYRRAANLFGIGCEPIPCPPDEECNPNTGQCEGACGGQTCAPGATCCSNQCVDTQTDPNNCGSCGNICPEDRSCVNGTCSPCEVGYTYCQGPGAPGGSQCCYPEQICCEGYCAPSGYHCCPGSLEPVCPPGQGCCAPPILNCGC
jgi:hypothetical protein